MLWLAVAQWDGTAGRTGVHSGGARLESRELGPHGKPDGSEAKAAPAAGTPSEKPSDVDLDGIERSKV